MEARHQQIHPARRWVDGLQCCFCDKVFPSRTRAVRHLAYHASYCRLSLERAVANDRYKLTVDEAKLQDKQHRMLQTAKGIMPNEARVPGPLPGLAQPQL
eukprot:2476099-Prorocentrum_lima.AAC.1